MAQEDYQEAPLAALLASSRAFVTYQPLRTEVRMDDFFAVPGSALVYEILPRASLDPLREAGVAREKIGNLPATVFMPGRRFDAFGTRLGQGGGWYDRFLAKAPVEWLRIGFCFEDQFSETLLPRQSWDELVDIVCVLERSTGMLRIIETRARSKHF